MTTVSEVPPVDKSVEVGTDLGSLVSGSGGAISISTLQASLSFPMPLLDFYRFGVLSLSIDLSALSRRSLTCLLLSPETLVLFDAETPLPLGPSEQCLETP